jgi:hypothetical protein
MAKDFTKLTHSERLALLSGQLASPASVRMASDVLNLMDTERLEVVALHDMAVRRHGGLPAAEPSLGAMAAENGSKDKGRRIVQTVADLVRLFRTSEKYRNLRFKVRGDYDRRIDRIMQDCGPTNLAELRGPDIRRLYELWSENGAKKPMGHGIITTLRILINFGVTALEEPECTRISVLLRGMRFKPPGSRTERLSEEQAESIIAKARRDGRDSIALAQAFQTDCALRQTDVLGEFVPHSEPGVSDVTLNEKKWLRGIRWSAIDNNLILRHTMSLDSKQVEIDLKKCPHVKAELDRMGKRPTSGPVIIDEDTGKPYPGYKFRSIWRRIATSVGVPPEIKNMDSRGSQPGAQPIKARR